MRETGGDGSQPNKCDFSILILRTAEVPEDHTKPPRGPKKCTIDPVLTQKHSDDSKKINGKKTPHPLVVDRLISSFYTGHHQYVRVTQYIYMYCAMRRALVRPACQYLPAKWLSSSFPLFPLFPLSPLCLSHGKAQIIFLIKRSVGCLFVGFFCLAKKERTTPSHFSPHPFPVFMTFKTINERLRIIYKPFFLSFTPFKPF